LQFWRWEPYIRYTGKNWISDFLCRQWVDMNLLAIVALNDWFTAIIVSRYLLFSCMPTKWLNYASLFPNYSNSQSFSPKSKISNVNEWQKYLFSTVISFYFLLSMTLVLSKMSKIIFFNQRLLFLVTVSFPPWHPFSLGAWYNRTGTHF
jgi:hypothetical protein